MFKSTRNSSFHSRGVLRMSILPAALTLCGSMSAQADNWQTGDIITYTQVDWASSQANLLTNNFNTVYFSTGGVLQIGSKPGFVDEFGGANDVLALIPAEGPAAALDGSLLNPTKTSAGIFAGDVTALKLNVDFSAAGITRGNSGLDFGDLVFRDNTADPVDGLSVKQILADADILLGGGTVHGAAGRSLTISGLDTDLVEINASFENGTVTSIAEKDLFSPTSSGGKVSPAPEIDPSGLAAGLTMLLGVLAVMRGRRGLR